MVYFPDGRLQIRGLLPGTFHMKVFTVPVPRLYNTSTQPLESPGQNTSVLLNPMILGPVGAETV
jgi:hypothetical protein